MNTADFDYHLPAELIAREPLPDRAASRMLALDRVIGTIRHEQFVRLGDHLRAGDLLVLNDTRVIPARIWASEPAVELLLVEKLGPCRWSALAKPGRKLKPGRRLTLAHSRRGAVVEAPTEFGGRVLVFDEPVEPYLQTHGAAPLPHYIGRDARAVADLDRYQTVYARADGAIAAPTAGLHFTPAILADLQARGIDHTFITLHVGIGTFRPVKTATVAEHPMHHESFVVTAETVRRMAAAERIIAVGTTVARTLETIGEPRAAAGRTNLFIFPPYEFKMIDALLTNFHLPRSTLLMLVSAFAGREFVLRAYAEAVRERYRFYSYGDCMLIM